MELKLNLRIRQLRYLKSMGFEYAYRRVRQKFIPDYLELSKYRSFFSGQGLEIGGPSPFFSKKGFIDIYSAAASVDNITFSSKTLWEGDLKSGKNFVFHPNKEPGYQYLFDDNNLAQIEDEKYDFIISCHMLEHTANPFKALYQWQRILKTGGKFLLILPHREGSFDHRREVTTIEHMKNDFKNNMPEDDSTHFEEILAKHNLTRDPVQESPATFRQWIINNKTNRGAHHHVFNALSAAKLVDEVGFQILDAEVALPQHICILSEKLSTGSKPQNKKFLNVKADFIQKSPFEGDRIFSENLK
jgi:SAM-dependent methyltransferase